MKILNKSKDNNGKRQNKSINDRENSVIRDAALTQFFHNNAMNNNSIYEDENCGNTTEEEEEDGIYEVEYVIDVKMDSLGDCKYLVKWKNYDHNYDSWEPAENFNHTQVIDEFWAKNRHMALEMCFSKQFRINKIFVDYNNGNTLV
uniref:Chromo domain-containing protein n=1 Tax=Strongyloides stercoralis TaxID=6248 RepID=A0A0K0EQ40_STRER